MYGSETLLITLSYVRKKKLLVRNIAYQNPKHVFALRYWKVLHP